MSGKQILGAILLAAGIFLLAYRGVTYTKQTHDVDIGPVEFQVKEKKHLDVPIWAGAAVAVVGGALLAFGRRS